MYSFIMIYLKAVQGFAGAEFEQLLTSSPLFDNTKIAEAVNSLKATKNPPKVGSKKRKRMGCGSSAPANAGNKPKKSLPRDQDTEVLPGHRTEAATNPLAGNTGALGCSQLSAFSFGDNGDARAIGDGDKDAEAPSAVVTRRATTTHTRREGVSADPILPDAAEKFVPRKIAKDKSLHLQLQKVVKSNPLFAALEAEELRTVVDAMDIEEFPKGTNVLTEGQPGTEKFYFIVEGTVDILKKSMGYICSFHAGQTFGEMELMYLSMCAATVQCKTMVKAFAIDRDTYRHIVMMVSIRKRKQYVGYLQNITFLNDMNNYQLTTLADALETKLFEADETLIPFGSEGDWMYVIIHGTVQVVGRDKQTGAKVKVCTFTAGDIIGELEFLNNHKTVADVIAIGEVKTCRLHRAHFEMCMGPVVDYLRNQTEQSGKYSYYNNITEDDGTGNKKVLTDFTFGEDNDGGSANAFGTSAFGNDGDEDGGDDGKGPNEGSSPKSRTQRAHGVSDEVMEEDKNWKPPVVPKGDEDTEMLKAVLKTNPLMSSLEPDDFKTVVLAMSKNKFSAGANVMTQGSEGGSHYYIISEGVVDILKNDKYICSFHKGQGFGEMELMYVQPVVATVKAKTDLIAWALDRQTYKRLVMQIAVKRRVLYSELVGNLDFLQGMSEYEKGTLADALSPVTFQPGSLIVRRGEQNESMYIIVSGKVEVLGVENGADDEAAATKHICFLERGSCVGELEFLNQHPAVANCAAFTEVRACTLHRDHFELCMGPIMDVLRKTVRQDKYAYYNQHLDDFDKADSGKQHEQKGGPHGGGGAARGRVRGNAVSAEVYDAAADHDYDPPVIAKKPHELDKLSVTVKRCPLFAALNAQERAVVIGALEACEFQPHAKIFVQGTVPEDPYWYIIAEGNVKQVKDDGTTTAQLGPGQSFGEMELMYATPAQVTTSVSSATPVHAFRLDRRSYRKLVMAVCQERRRLYRELLSGVPFASQLSEQQSLVLADALTPIKFQPGDVMIKFGDHNEWMYIIVDGVVEVLKQNMQEIVCELRRGEMVGELEFLNKHATVANCIAKTHTQALKLHRDHFEMCLGPCTAFMKEILKQAKYAYYNNTQKR